MRRLTSSRLQKHQKYRVERVFVKIMKIVRLEIKLYMKPFSNGNLYIKFGMTAAVSSTRFRVRSSRPRREKIL